MHSKYKSPLPLVLAFTIATTACSPNWINVALQDLPVLTQMALNIATLASTLSPQQNPADLPVIQNISSQASRDLNLLLTLYNEYKDSPNTTSLGKIQSAIGLINQHLPALLESARISNALLKARVHDSGQSDSRYCKQFCCSDSIPCAGKAASGSWPASSGL